MKSLRYCLPIILFNSQLLCWISLACLAAWSNPAGATIRYVNGTAASGGNGSTWVLSYQNLQDAIDASASGDEIWVTAAPTLKNRIVYGNTYLGNPGALIDNSLPNVSYSIIEIGFGTGTDLNTNPQFVSSSNLPLQSASPALNAGTSPTACISSTSLPKTEVQL